MRKQQLIVWAVKGITAEIGELEKTVFKGYQLLKDIDEGKPIKSPLNVNEIRFVIAEKKAEIEKLDKERFNLRWELSEIE